MSRYNSYTTDPISNRIMTSFSRSPLGVTTNYNFLDINKVFLPAGRVELLSYMVYGEYDLWYILSNNNFEYDNPFDLMRKDFDSEDGTKYIRIPSVGQNNQSSNNSASSNALDL